MKVNQNSKKINEALDILYSLHIRLNDFEYASFCSALAILREVREIEQGGFKDES